MKRFLIGRTIPTGYKLYFTDDFVTQGNALIGKRGSGKSQMAGLMMEFLAETKRPFVVFDPPNAHWGLKYKRDTFKPSGYNLLVIGGPHADIPLVETGGKELAALIADKNISLIIEMREMGMGERKRFTVDFQDTLFKLNKIPRHIFYEEAQNFLPQQPKFDEQIKMLYSSTKITDEGRGVGLGYTIITQRTTKVNKDPLGGVDNLFVMKTFSPGDKKMLSEWFKDNLGNDQKLSEITASLSKLKPGDCWLLSPDWLERVVEFHGMPRRTYHAGETLKTKARIPRFKKVHLTAIAAKFKDLLLQKQQQEQEEVQTLKEAKTRLRNITIALSVERKKYKELEAEKQKVLPGSKALSKAETKQIVKAIWREEMRKVEEWMKKVKAAILERNKALRAAEKSMTDALAEVFPEIPVFPDVPLLLQRLEQRSKIKPPAPAPPPSKPAFGAPGSKFALILPARRAKDAGAAPESNGNQPLKAGARRMLAALAQWHPAGMTPGQMRAQAGMKKSGTYDSYLSSLRTGGLAIEKDGLLFATEAGVEHIGEHRSAAPTTTQEVLAIWKPKLKAGARRILDAIIAHRGSPVSVEEILAASGMQKSGTFDSYMSSLRTAHLIVKSDLGYAADKDSLFL